ncbi:MAG: NAD-dependent epimerase/dehydratase family protein [Alcanivoracaceae bacterium]|nr:NAD-dependent epimerase/dehydratase family protein [Alcanivoracaceae bacterium]
MKIAVITGSSGLIGAESVRFFAARGYTVVGIDNNSRQDFFGQEASTIWQRNKLLEEVSGYQHHNIDIRDMKSLDKIFSEHKLNIKLIIHTAAQPSHDWAAKDPITDFSINALGTLNLLEVTRKHCKQASFIFTSTNNVYGDLVNRLPLIEQDQRWELEQSHKYFKHGIDENMSIDASEHTIFGASKVAADVMVQEYGRYFDMNTVVFRGGCLTGPCHSSTKLHGFLSYLMKCALSNETYQILGYKGKQVRDNIHSYDLVNMFWHYAQNPRAGEVYNAGGGRHSHCSILEAIEICQSYTGEQFKYKYVDSNRRADHMWWVSDTSKFKSHYPTWDLSYSLSDIIGEIYHELNARLSNTNVA